MTWITAQIGIDGAVTEVAVNLAQVRYVVRTEILSGDEATRLVFDDTHALVLLMAYDAVKALLAQEPGQ